MTKQQLIDALRDLPDLDVMMEGCDCDGLAGSVSVEGSDGKPVIYIHREPGW